ncbi:hypothetical protein JYU34_011196 [Plutella xylostella]|uniref:Uncharacterized protein n=1 Tax=Plutella xylostella TaxID=51655 RepID=A0ABQ7QGA6_PLUXY|nr:hypothetical protein JYU34_011196 [Plutella xylostella]
MIGPTIILCVILSADFAIGRGVQQNQTKDNVYDEMVKHLPGCHYSDPKVTECIQKAAEEAKVLLAHGVPSLGIQPLEPLKVPSVRLRQHNGPNKGLKYDAWLSDVTLKGLTDYKVNQMDIFPEKLKVLANISLPHLQMSGEFVILGHFQMLPVESTGKLSANFTMCSASIEALGARVHKRMVVRDAVVRLKCAGPLQADLDEAHSATGEMEMITDHIVQMHSNEIIAEVQPAVETTLAMVLEDIANKFLKHVPYDMVFPN